MMDRLYEQRSGSWAFQILFLYAKSHVREQPRRGTRAISLQIVVVRSSWIQHFKWLNSIRSFPPARHTNLLPRSSQLVIRLPTAKKTSCSPLKQIQDRKSTRLNSSHQIISYAV